VDFTKRTPSLHGGYPSFDRNELAKYGHDIKKLLATGKSVM
jgi:hypothetical protein